MSGSGCLQNLRNVTVQIRSLDGRLLAGTGLIVSLDGHIITSAHVLRVIDVDPHQPAEVCVLFPQARSGERACYPAVVVVRGQTDDESAADHDADLVMLHMRDECPLLMPEQVALPGHPGASHRHRCRIYAYLPGDESPIYAAEGTLVVEGLSQPELHLHSAQATPALNGAAVLDIERNLIVGMLSDASPIDTTILCATTEQLTHPPFDLALWSVAPTGRVLIAPPLDREAAREVAVRNPGLSLIGAPPCIDVWAGHDGLLRALNADWSDLDQRVTTIIGPSGCGKSTLARHWLEHLLSDRLQRQPDGVFWWNFSERPSVDAFFAALLAYLSGRLVDIRQYPSATTQAQFLSAMLSAGSYLIILDDIEQLQYARGDMSGCLRSTALRDLLRFAAASWHDSFFLITSSLPILDLLDFASVTQRDIASLTIDHGRTLLKRRGMHGLDADLDSIIMNLDGHALTLTLMSGYLHYYYHGDVMEWRKQNGEVEIIPRPTQHRPPLHRVLALLDEHLNDAQRMFLRWFCAFRVPVDERTLADLFGTRPSFFDRFLRRAEYALISPLTQLSSTAFETLLTSLAELGLLRYDSPTHAYHMHPLIRDYYHVMLCASPHSDHTDHQPHSPCTIIHTRIRDHYLKSTGELPRFPTIDDLVPLIEAVYHAQCAGLPDEAFRIYWEHIEQGDRKAFGHQLGAYDTLLVLMQSFFPDGDMSAEPHVSNPVYQQQILDTVGFCLVNMERLSEAMPFYERKNDLLVKINDHQNAGIGYRNLSSLYTSLGLLEKSALAAEAALQLARQQENTQSEMAALVYRAWVHHLRGHVDEASELFRQAEQLQQQLDNRHRYLYSQDGVWHADHVRCRGDTAYARQITQKNLELCEEYRWVRSLSQCRRLLGDMDAAIGQHERARQHYDEALSLARSIGHRPTLIEVLSARGRWAVRRLEEGTDDVLQMAQSNLEEALEYAIASGERLHEMNIRVGLAWLLAAHGNRTAARAHGHCVQRCSEAMGYAWGSRDATEVLAALDDS